MPGGGIAQPGEHQLDKLGVTGSNPVASILPWKGFVLEGIAGKVKVVVTSGGTSEPIDSVRSITNMSTGQLGSLVAQRFCECPGVEVFYICSRHAARPGLPVNVKTITTVSELQGELTTLLTNHKIDAVIHAMAVSDYKVSGIVIDGDIVDVAKTKVPSHHESLMLKLCKTPKVIKIIKQLQPTTKLVGFKLLKDVSQQELIQTGHKLLINNQCDFVLANDLLDIQPPKHVGYLIYPNASYSRLTTKEEIAAAIVHEIRKAED